MTRSGPSESASEASFSALLARARAGDAEGVAQLYENHSVRVMSIVRRRLTPLLRAKYDTMDLAHSVFLEVLRELPALEDRGEAAFANLLAIKAESKVRLKLRRHLGREGRRAENRLETDEAGPPSGPDAAAAAASRDDDAKLRLLLSQTDEDARRILTLHSEGASFADIAQSLGLPSAEAVRKRHARALLALRDRWKRAVRLDPSCK